jgi:ribonuclease HI
MKPTITKLSGGRASFKGKFCDFTALISNLRLEGDGWFCVKGEKDVSPVRLRLSEEKEKELITLLKEKTKKVVLDNTFEGVLYTDGSANPNPGKGGWGALLYNSEGKEVLVAKGGHQRCGNGKMEIRAMIEGLRLVPEGSTVVAWTDAKYCLNTVGEGALPTEGPTGWIKGWERRGWKKADGKGLENLVEIKELSVELRRHCEAGTNLTFKWVKSHSGVKGNERADELADEGREGTQ